jgi:hypothetical protein
MTVFVRVRLDNGSEASVSAAFAELHRLTPLGKKEAAAFGVALDPKHPVRKSSSPARADDTTPKEK